MAINGGWCDKLDDRSFVVLPNWHILSLAHAMPAVQTVQIHAITRIVVPGDTQRRRILNRSRNKTYRPLYRGGLQMFKIRSNVNKPRRFIRWHTASYGTDEPTHSRYIRFAIQVAVGCLSFIAVQFEKGRLQQKIPKRNRQVQRTLVQEKHMNTSIMEALGTELVTVPVPMRITSNSGGAEAAMPPLPDLRLRTILVPFDFSDVSTALLRGLVELAEGTGAVLHILHVVEPPLATETSDRRSSSTRHEAHAEAARRQLKEWTAKTWWIPMPTTTTVRIGRAVDEIVSQAQLLGADLIVMSAHVGRSLKNVLVRTTTERVARLSACPVLVIPKDMVSELLTESESYPPRSWQRILLPLDPSHQVPGALAYAAAIALANGAMLHLLHAVTGATPSVAGDVPSARRRLAKWLRAELRWPVEVEATVRSGTPLTYAILAEASRIKADAIVLPTQDGSWFQRHRLWSVTDSILRHARCPVLCVNENANR